jgi:hypothetical protein
MWVLWGNTANKNKKEEHKTTTTTKH